MQLSDGTFLPFELSWQRWLRMFVHGDQMIRSYIEVVAPQIWSAGGMPKCAVLFRIRACT